MRIDLEFCHDKEGNLFKTGRLMIERFRDLIESTTEPSFLIRFGNRATRDEDSYFGVYNSSSALYNSKDKYRSAKMLFEVGIGIRPYRYNELKDAEYPILGRNRHHRNGNDIALFKSKDVIREMEFYTEYKENINEYRVHVFNGESICIIKKFPIDGKVKSNIIRSTTNGWKFRVIKDWNSIKPSKLEQLRDKSETAINSLGLDFGAVDLIEEPDGNILVLEVNTAPALDENEQERDVYELAIRRALYEIEEDGRNDRRISRLEEKLKSYGWKNNTWLNEGG